MHSDNGGPMKGETMLATMQRLGVAHRRSRAAVSNDNPYSESLFKTLKYRPQFPLKPFADLMQASRWVTELVRWYNEEHRHSAISFATRRSAMHKPTIRCCRHVSRFTKTHAKTTLSAGQRKPVTGPSSTPFTSTQTALKPRSQKSKEKRLDLTTSCDNWLDSFRHRPARQSCACGRRTASRNPGWGRPPARTPWRRKASCIR